MYRLGKNSLARLAGVHPDLVRVVERAIHLTEVDFAVTEGLRTRARQAELYRLKATRTMDSRHLTGHAVDLVAVIDGRVTWEWPVYPKIADAMRQAARELGVPIRWGGDWDGDGQSTDERFLDGPHFELPAGG